METGYLQNGQKVHVVAEANDGFLVRDHYSDEYDDEYIGELTYWVERVHAAAPTEVYDSKIVALQARITELQKQVEAGRESLRELEQSAERYRKYEQLKHLDALLDGKITHYVITRWKEPRLYTVDELLKWDRSHRPKMPLLSLFGSQDGVLAWNLNRYGDGSGDKYNAVPCASREEGIAILQAWLDSELASEKRSWKDDSYIEYAAHYDLNIDPAIIEREKKRLQAEKVCAVDKAKAGLHEAEKELAGALE